MKKLLILPCFALMAFFASSQTLPLAIQMTTSKSKGEIISIDIAKYTPGDIQIDWGNEIKETYTISNISKNIRGTTGADNAIIKIYGESITFLECQTNKLTSLTVSNNPDLVSLYCGNNSLSELNIQSNLKLEVLSAYSNSLSSIDVSKNTKLKNLMLTNNKLTSLNVKNNIYLCDLSCDLNLLDACAWNDLYRSLPDRSMEAVKGKLYAGYPASNTELKSSNTKLVTPGWSVLESYPDGKAVTGDATGCYNALFTTSKDINQPISLNLTLSTAGLVDVNWGDGNWVKYEVGTSGTAINGTTKAKNAIIRIQNDNLTVIDCSGNQLIEVDVRKSANITQLHCNNNNLEWLNLTENKKLTVVSCYSNAFTACGYDSIYRSLPDRSSFIQISGKLYIANTLVRLPASITTSNTKLAKSQNWNTLNKINEEVLTGDGTGCNTALAEINQLVSLYPNPVNDILRISLPEQNYNLKVINMTGEILINKKMETNNLQVSQLEPGMYIIFIDTGETLRNMKFVKTCNSIK